MRAFEIHQPKPPAPNAKPTPPRRRRRRWLLAAAFLLVLAGGWWAFRPDPQVARARALQQELFAGRQSGPPTDDRKAKMQEFRQAVSGLSAGQKRELFEPMRQKAKQEFDRYFTLDKAGKTAYLDGLLDRAEKGRVEREQRAKPGGGANGGGANGGPNSGGNGFGPPPGAGKAKLTPDEIEERKKKRLDQTTPEDRAKRDQFRHDMEERRKQRGLPPGGGRRGSLT